MTGERGHYLRDFHTVSLARRLNRDWILDRMAALARSSIAAASRFRLAWLGCSVYEAMVHAGIICPASCDIRIDALVIYPALAVVSLIPFIKLALSDLVGAQKGRF
jgi:hypothetical protein